MLKRGTSDAEVSTRVKEIIRALVHQATALQSERCSLHYTINNFIFWQFFFFTF
jgi:hypothetical protein